MTPSTTIVPLLFSKPRSMKNQPIARIVLGVATSVEITKRSIPRGEGTQPISPVVAPAFHRDRHAGTPCDFSGRLKLINHRSCDNCNVRLLPRLEAISN